MSTKRPCRCCGKLMRENTRLNERRVEDAQGFHHDAFRVPDGTYGYAGSGICTQRCGFEWANSEAPKHRVFASPYQQYAARNGSSFEVVREIVEPDATHDIEALPMYVIRFADGVEIEAHPEEIGMAER